MSILLVFFIIFFIRKLIIKNFNERLKQERKVINLKTQSCFNINTRFENLSKQQIGYKDIYRNVNIAYNEVNKILYKITEDLDFYKTNSKKKFNWKFVKSYKNSISSFKMAYERIDTFMKLSEKLNEKWNLVDDSWSIILESIIQINNYLTSHEKLLKNTGPEFYKKIGNISKKLTEVNSRKTQTSFEIIDGQINSIKEELLQVIEFIDSLMSFEWILYDHLTKLIENLRGDEVYQELKNLLINLQTNIATYEYSNFTSKILFIYRYIYDYHNNNINSSKLNELLIKNKEIFEKLYNQISGYEETINQNKKIANSININEYIESYKKIETKIKTYQDLEIFLIKSFDIYNWVIGLPLKKSNEKECDEDISKKSEYLKNLFFEISASSLIPNDDKSELLKNEVHDSFVTYNKLLKTYLNDKKHENWLLLNKSTKELQDGMKELIHIISDNTAYKEMYDFLAEKIANSNKKKKNESEQERAQLLYECNLLQDLNDYKSAYHKLSTFIKNKGNNV
ncbi:hypothetical protein MCRO_0210 [Mycoplasma crocodyli MP145]|uniref:Uncharacterized protein n=1 Tax=Mycoplasma crocodyli (strain ATCC 51981 / MP145) TaxID=512564 RepID=D5E521_MYCCM|nr:hypothetical protein MCRO_0210 [Mycoplasma crocodyli MP145]